MCCRVSDLGCLCSGLEQARCLDRCFDDIYIAWYNVTSLSICNQYLEEDIARVLRFSGVKDPCASGIAWPCRSARGTRDSGLCVVLVIALLYRTHSYLLTSRRSRGVLRRLIGPPKRSESFLALISEASWDIMTSAALVSVAS
jgi:hypothetical protein